MKMKITYKDSIRIAFISGFVGILIFLMVQVLMAQILLDTIISLFETGNLLILTIIMIGFIISMVISIIAGFLTSDLLIEKKYVLSASILSFLSNFAIWVLISYLYVAYNFPELFQDTSVFEKIIIFPTVIGYFAIYYLQNVTYLWIYSGVTYSILFAIFLKGLGSQQKAKRKYGYYN